MGNKPYLKESTGKDLRRNRQKLLARYQKKHHAETKPQVENQAMFQSEK